MPREQASAIVIV